MEEARASLNFFGITRKGWNVQFTLRDDDEMALMERFAAFVVKLEEVQHVVPKPVGQQAANLRQTAPEAPGQAQLPPPTPGVPLPAPAAPEGGTATCAMIEVGTAYTSGKTQLKFHCDGFENPLTYTKGVDEMVKLLAQLGFTAAHIVVGQKYPVNALVRWVQKGDYKNVLEIHSA